MNIVHRGTEPEGRAIGDELGIAYDGIQPELGFQFTDVKQTGTTFYARTLEEARAGLAKKRGLFAKHPPVSVVEYDRSYTLKELREMAKGRGVSSSGSKKEIARRLIQ